ncbi:MAG: Homogentisate 1,2-dioxygenase, partial [Humibacillus sp.]|nr:Homogentisate 1,2-dioxygenase [Humibacillus sp.]
VMVDTFRPLELGEGGLAVDDGRYAASWSTGLRAVGAREAPAASDVADVPAAPDAPDAPDARA